MSSQIKFFGMDYYATPYYYGSHNQHVRYRHMLNTGSSEVGIAQVYQNFENFLNFRKFLVDESFMEDSETSEMQFTAVTEKFDTSTEAERFVKVRPVRAVPLYSKPLLTQLLLERNYAYVPNGIFNKISSVSFEQDIDCFHVPFLSFNHLTEKVGQFVETSSLIHRRALTLLGDVEGRDHCFKAGDAKNMLLSIKTVIDSLAKEYGYSLDAGDHIKVLQLLKYIRRGVTVFPQILASSDSYEKNRENANFMYDKIFAAVTAGVPTAHIMVWLSETTVPQERSKDCISETTISLDELVEFSTAPVSAFREVMYIYGQS